MIDKYLLVYSITALPTVIYSSWTPANQPLTFDKDKLHIPQELKGMVVELRVSMYAPTGDIVEMTSTMLPSSAATICTSANLTGLKLVKKLIANLTKEIRT